MNDIVTFEIAETELDFEQGKKLFREYVESLGVDLSFQDFENELKMVHMQYSNPSGALILAMTEDAAVGCAGIRKLDERVAELKRMYVNPSYRGQGIGAGLLQVSMAKAKELGYKKMRLDTLRDMTKAQELYSLLGFYTIPAYRFNPLEGTVFMEKEL